MNWLEKLSTLSACVLTTGHRVYTLICPTGYQCFELTDGSRKRLLERFPPRFSQIEAQHITYDYGVSAAEKLPPTPKIIEVVGYASDDSIECVVVEVDGQVFRCDGQVYHVTLSREPHRRARESNDLLKSEWKKEENLFLAAEPQFRVIQRAKRTQPGK